MGLKLLDTTRNGVLLYESKHQRGDKVGEHYHRVHQVLFVLDGEGEIALDGRKHRLSQDKAAFIVPYCSHSIVSEDRLTLLVLAFDKDVVNVPTLDAVLNAGLNTACLLQLNPLSGGELRRLLRNMLFEQAKPDPLSGQAVVIYLQELLLHLARNRQPFPSMDSNRLRAERIRSYIDSHYFEKIHVQDIAARLGITARYVNDIFKSEYGMTPTQYLTEVRIACAKKLLAETDKDIVSIAFEVGYETLSTFYRNFKIMVNVSPHHFRQMRQTRI